MARDLLTPPGQGDDGEPDESLTRALGRGPGADLPTLVAALRQARVFVGVEARLTSADAATGADKTSEMALATLRTPSGATALPIFSCIATLTAWRPSARPVPVAAADAFAEAVRLGLGAVVIDVAGPASVSLDVELFAPPAPGAAAPAPVAPSGADSGERADSPDHGHALGSADDPGRAGLADDGDGDGGDGDGGVDRAVDLRRPADARGPLDRRRVRRVLRAVTEDVEVWPAELVEAAGAAPRPVLALAVRSAPGGDPEAVAVIARRLGELLGVDGPRYGGAGPGPRGPGAADGSAMAVLVVDAQEIPAVRRHLGRGLRSRRRWPPRAPRR